MLSVSDILWKGSPFVERNEKSMQISKTEVKGRKRENNLLIKNALIALGYPAKNTFIHSIRNMPVPGKVHKVMEWYQGSISPWYYFLSRVWTSGVMQEACERAKWEIRRYEGYDRGWKMEVIQRANRHFRRLQISGFMERGMNHPFMNSLAKHLRNVAHLVRRDLRFALVEACGFYIICARARTHVCAYARMRNDVNYRYLRKNINDAK